MTPKPKRESNEPEHAEKTVDTPAHVLVRLANLWEACASSRLQSDNTQNVYRFRMKAMAGTQIGSSVLMGLLPVPVVVIVSIIILGRFRRFG
jgi:hypothetical protein